MNETKYAQLDSEQLEKINELEQKIGVTLIAYELPQNDSYRSQSNTQEHRM